MQEKKMPCNLDAEQSVLGAMFLSKYALQKAVETLNKDLFYLEANGKIFEVMSLLAEQNIPIDATTVTSELENKNISVRKRREKDTVTMDTDEFINNLLEEIKTKAQ